jgi:hypothetical protein
MRRAVAAQHNLFLRVIKGIERMKKFVLSTLFSSQKLHIVHQQDIDAAIPLAEIDQAVVPHRIDHLVHKPL